MKKVIIVGGGVAGLSTGVYCLKNGFAVEIYEKNAVVGGFLTGWYRSGALIDGCLHWLLGTKPGTALNNIWQELGAFDLDKMIYPSSFHRSVSKSGTLTFYRSADDLETDLLRVSEGDEEEIASLMTAVRTIGVLEPPTKVAFELAEKGDINVDIRLIARFRKYYSITVGELAERFHSPVIRFAIKNSLVNEKFSAFYFLQTLSNFCQGNDDLPLGCSLKMCDNIKNTFLSLGGKIFIGKEVRSVNVEGGAARSITLKNGEEVAADYVVCAGDLHHTFNELLPTYALGYENYDGEKASYPTYSFMIASFKTKRDFSENEISEIFEVEPYAFLGKEYTAFSVRHYGYDESLKSDGYTTVQVMLTTYEDDYEKIKGLSKEDYRALKAEFGAFAGEKLKALYGGEFELIDVLSPLTFERYMHAYKGTFMPYALTPKKSQFLRSSKVEGLENVFLANQWLMTPGGVGVAAVTGKFASQLIAHAEGKNYRY